MGRTIMAVALGLWVILFSASVAGAGEKCLTWDTALENQAKSDSDYVVIKLTVAQTDELHAAKDISPMPGWSYGYAVNIDLDPTRAVVFVFDEKGCFLDYMGVDTARVLDDLALLADKPQFALVPKGPKI